LFILYTNVVMPTFACRLFILTIAYHFNICHLSLFAPVEFLVMFVTWFVTNQNSNKAALWKTDALDCLEEKEEGKGCCEDTVKRFNFLLE